MKCSTILACLLLIAFPAWSRDGVTSSTEDALINLDGRRPLPLLPMMADHQKQDMREHLRAVQEIVAALGSDDFESIRRAAARLGYSEQVSQMCQNMGAAAPEFTMQALAFHHAADAIAAAAHDRDRNRVITKLAATLKACTACHATWKQEPVDETTWLRLTSAVQHTPGPHR